MHKMQTRRVAFVDEKRLSKLRLSSFPCDPSKMTQECVPKKNHANDFAFSEEKHPWDSNSSCAVHFMSDRFALRSMLGLLLPIFDPATFRVGVMTVKLCVRVTHEVAGSTGI